VKHFDPISVIIILITLVLFLASLFEKGFTHDLMLEAGVFLVSAKLIQAAYHASLNQKKLEAKLDDILNRLDQG
jgi:hypothetical protein